MSRVWYPWSLVNHTADFATECNISTRVPGECNALQVCICCATVALVYQVYSSTAVPQYCSTTPVVYIDPATQPVRVSLEQTLEGCTRGTYGPMQLVPCPLPVGNCSSCGSMIPGIYQTGTRLVLRSTGIQQYCCTAVATTALTVAVVQTDTAAKQQTTTVVCIQFSRSPIVWCTILRPGAFYVCEGWRDVREYTKASYQYDSTL